MNGDGLEKLNAPSIFKFEQLVSDEAIVKLILAEDIEDIVFSVMKSDDNVP